MQDLSRAGKYVLFLGAGASKPFGTPDMAELSGACDRAVRTYSATKQHKDWEREECRLWQAVCRQVEPHYDEDLASSLRTRCQIAGFGHARIGDLEAILRVLDILSSEAFPDAFRAVGWPPPTNALTQFPEPADVSRQARNLHEFVTDEMLRLLQPLPVAQRLGSYEQLVCPLRGLGPELVATTNYDTNLEQRAPELQLYDGFDVSGNWVGFPEAASRQGAPWRVDLAKLHGSVNWYAVWRVPEPEVHRSGLTVGARPVGADGMPCQPYLILPPALKDRASDRVAASLRERLWRGLMQAELIVLVGYSLRDDYLQDMLVCALDQNSDLRLLLVGPHAEAIRSRFVGLFDEQVHAVTASFGRKEFGSQLRDALREQVGIHLTVPPSTQRVTYRSRFWTPVPESASMVGDPLAFGGEVIVVPKPQHPQEHRMVLYGPYATLDPAGQYKAFFRVRAPGAESLPASRDVIVLELASRQAPAVATDEGAQVVSHRVIRAGELCPSNRFATFDVDFDWPLDVWDRSSLEMRIITIPHGPHPSSLSELRIDTRWVRYVRPLTRKVWVPPAA